MMAEGLGESVSCVVQFVLGNSASLDELAFATHMSQHSEVPGDESIPLYSLVQSANTTRHLIPLLQYLRLALLKNQWKRLSNWQLLSSLLPHSQEKEQLLLLEMLAIGRVNGSTIAETLNGLVGGETAISLCAESLLGMNNLDEMTRYILAHVSDETLYGPVVQCLDARGHQYHSDGVSSSYLWHCQDMYTFINCIRVFHHYDRASISGSSHIIARFSSFQYDKALERAMRLSKMDVSPAPNDYMLYDLAQYVCDMHVGDLTEFTLGLHFLLNCLDLTKKPVHLPLDFYKTLARPEILQPLAIDIQRFILKQASNPGVSDSHLRLLATPFTTNAMQLNLSQNNILLLFLQLIYHRKSSPDYLHTLGSYIEALYEQIPSLPDQVLSELSEPLGKIVLYGNSDLQALISRKQDQLLEKFQKTPSLRKVSRDRSKLLCSLYSYFPNPEELSEERNIFAEFLDFVINALDKNPALLTVESPVIVPFNGVPSYESMVAQLRYLIGKKETDKANLVSNLQLFISLRESVICSFMTAGPHHPFISLYIVSKLRKLFLGQIVVDPTLGLLSELENEVAQLDISSFVQVNSTRLTFAAPFLQSKAILQAYKNLDLSPISLASWGSHIYYSSISGVYGLTLFGGIVLVKNQYSDESDFAKLGFLLTIIHESAHLFRRLEASNYNIEKLTPTKAGGEKDLLVKGIPGSAKWEDYGYSDTDQGEGGIKLEEQLFGKMVIAVTRKQRAYLLDPENWEVSLEYFRSELETLGTAENLEAAELARTQRLELYQRDNHCDF